MAYYMYMHVKSKLTSGSQTQVLLFQDLCNVSHLNMKEPNKPILITQYF